MSRGDETSYDTHIRDEFSVRLNSSISIHRVFELIASLKNRTFKVSRHSFISHAFCNPSDSKTCSALHQIIYALLFKLGLQP